MLLNPYRFGAAYVGPLDVYSTNVWGAWSIARKLKAAYAGNAIKIREDGGDTETDIGYDSDGLLDEAAIASHCGANGGFVTRCYDHTGNGNDLLQATASLQMPIYDGAAVRVNTDGFPGMYNGGYSGGSSRHHVKSAQDTGLVQPATVFLYGEDVAYTNGYCRFDGYPTSGFGNLSQQRVNGTELGLYAGLHITGPTGEITIGEPFVKIGLFNGTSTRGKIDANSDVTGSVGTNVFHGFTWGGFSGGPGNSNANCYQNEALVYNEAVGSSDRDAIRGNMNDFYSAY